MTDFTALKRITRAVNKECKGESQAVKDYIVNLIYLTWQTLELDTGAIDENGRPYTSSKNLQFALEINLEYEYQNVIDEARKEVGEQ